MPRVGKRRKKRRSNVPAVEEAGQEAGVPRCFVIRRGKNALKLQGLVRDFRQVMMPNVAMRLKETKTNRTEDFVAVAGHFGVTHMVVFTTTAAATYMKIGKLPQGPTLTFRVDSFSLGRDVRDHQKRQRMDAHDFRSCALQVLSGFTGKLPEPKPTSTPEKSTSSTGRSVGYQERTLMAEMLRGMFPAIDVPTFKPGECRRAALFHYDAEKDVVHFRQYSVGRKEAGLQRGVMKLLRTRVNRIPKMGGTSDVADWVLNGGGVSDSEAEDGMEVQSNEKRRTAVKLTEVGPRLELQLFKVEENLLQGSILYHRLPIKPPSKEEVLEQKARQKRKLEERNAELAEKTKVRKAEMKAKEKRKRDAQKDEDEEEAEVKGGNARK